MAASAVRAESLEGSARRRAYGLALKLRRAEQELADVRQQADEAKGAQRALLSGLNHELRTPLNAITGFAGLLKETGELGVPDEKRDEYLEHILYSAALLLERIDAILAAANKTAPEEDEQAAEAVLNAVEEQPEPEPELEEPGGDVATALKDLIQEFHGSLFVTQVVIDSELPRSVLSDDEITSYLHSLFSLIVRGGRQRHSIGVRLKFDQKVQDQFIVLELMLPRGADQPTHDEIKQLHLGEGSSLIAMETFRPPDGRMMLRLNIPILQQES